VNGLDCYYESILVRDRRRREDSKDAPRASVLLVSKYYIFCTIQDSDDVPFDSFPSLPKNKLNTSQQIAVKNKTSENFNKKWKDFIWVFSFTYLVKLLIKLINS